MIPQVSTDPRERTRAIGVYTAVGASSFAGGLVLGGVLTDLASWRSIFAVLTGICTLVLIAAKSLPRDEAIAERHGDGSALEPLPTTERAWSRWG